jgi:hypothetical protein
VGNVTGVQKTPAAQRVVGLTLGVVLLGLLVVLAVALPKAEGATDTEPAEAATAADLPDTLPGGWTATDALQVDELPAEAGVDEAAIQRQADSRAYAEQVYADVYDDVPAFRVYTDDTLQRYALVTVFVGESRAFLPGEPPIDPEAVGAANTNTELRREGDALCSVSNQVVAAGQQAGEPTSVSCQQPVAGQTVQVETQGVTLDDTFAFLDEVATAVS